MQQTGFREVEVVGKSGDGGIDLNAVADESDFFFSGTHVRIDVLEIGQFLTANIYERSLFRAVGCKVKSIIERYNLSPAGYRAGPGSAVSQRR